MNTENSSHKKIPHLFALLFLIVPIAYAENNNAIDRFIANYRTTYTALGLGGEMDLSYQKQISLYLQSKKLPQQHRFFSDLTKQRSALQRSPELPHASTFQTLQLKQIDFEIELHQEKTTGQRKPLPTH